MTKKIIMVMAAATVIIILYLLTYIPHKIITIEATDVAKIEIFDGALGKKINIEGKNEIQHIIENLNSISFYKGKCSIGYMGYRFLITIYDNDGGKYKKFIVNSEDTIRYNGFFYKDKESGIDYNYLNELVKKAK